MNLEMSTIDQSLTAPVDKVSAISKGHGSDSPEVMRHGKMQPDQVADERRLSYLFGFLSLRQLFPPTDSPSILCTSTNAKPPSVLLILN